MQGKRDDYNAIMVQALADRLAEASAEWLHERVRREWGYAKGEKLSKEDLIRVRYRGIRPAPGYSARPDDSEKRFLFELLEVHEKTEIRLMETFGIMPAASICGFYFSHPDARYFSLGRIGKDQVESYASRKRIDLAQAEHWLAPNLGY